MRRLGQALLAGTLAIGAAPPARAWNDHALATWVALQPMSAQAPLDEVVRAESLERFLAAEAPKLERLLDEHEAWARANLSPYAPRPDGIAFRAGTSARTPPAAAASGGAVAPGEPGGDLRQRFLKALRLNVAARLPLYRQLRAGEGAGPLRPLPWQEVSAFSDGNAGGARLFEFVALDEGSEVPALEVLATASQEPDFGLDIGLYADSGTAHGRLYGFGNQPFGNPALAFGSQAPFHMGLYHEARIVFAAASFLRRTQTEARIALFTALARHALQSGHRYWGWRFTGWALHYVQDLTQPYHASILPGLSPLRMIGINTVAMVGWTGPKTAATTLVSNRHAVVESYQQQQMAQAWRAGRLDDPLLIALRDTRDDASRGAYRPEDTRTRVSREAFDAAASLDAQLERSFPARYTADPQVELRSETDDLDMVAISRQHAPAEQERLQQQLAALLKNLGVHTRALVRAVLFSAAN